MKQFIQKMALVALVLTLVTACQKEEISPDKTGDQVTLRTLTFGHDELVAIHATLLAQVNTLIEEGELSGPNGNGLIPQLNNLLRAINRGVDDEANRILEEDILPHLAGLLEDGVLDQAQYNTLYAIATNQTDPTEGDVTFTGPDGVTYTYHWKKMADGKKWLVENLRHPLEGYQPLFYPGVDQTLYGGLYTWDAANDACNYLAGQGIWRLPSNEDWLELGRAYATENDIDPWTYYESPEVWESIGVETNDVYGYLVANDWNTSDDLSVGFNVLMGGYYNEGFSDLGQLGLYASSDDFSYNDLIGNYSACFFSLGEGSLVQMMPIVYPYGYSCRCVLGD